MSRAPSLTGRLTFIILLVEFVGAFVALSTSYSLELLGLVGNRDMLISDYAINHVHRLVVDSLTRDETGALGVAPTAALRSRLSRTPSLQFAVFEALDRPALPGSSAELSALLKHDGALKSRGQRFAIAARPGRDGRGYLIVDETPHGRLLVAASG